jgi:hypothetical protein
VFYHRWSCSASRFGRWLLTPATHGGENEDLTNNRLVQAALQTIGPWFIIKRGSHNAVMILGGRYQRLVVAMRPPESGEGN